MKKAAEFSVAATVAYSLPQLLTPEKTLAANRRVETNHSVKLTGTFTTYDSDALMEQVVATRFGIRPDFFFEPQVQSDIASLSSLEEIHSLQYWAEPLVHHPAQFRHMNTRLSDSEMLWVLQGICDPEKGRPFFIAPDTYNFYADHAEAFIGSYGFIRTWQQLDDEGQLLDLQEPAVFSALIIDNRALEHHHHGNPMLSDADPSTIAAITGAHWQSEQRVFTTATGKPVRRLPEVELEIMRL